MNNLNVSIDNPEQIETTMLPNDKVSKYKVYQIENVDK